jgi:hypothetical protein
MNNREAVTHFISEGKTTRQIAELLNISVSGVRYYRQPSKQRIQEHRRKIKRKSIDLSGGSCLRCGYNACDAAMIFHHVNPEEKDFCLNGNCRSWERCRVELNKTVMFCCRCHVELHSGLWTMHDEMIEKQAEIRRQYVDKPLIEYCVEIPG